MSNQSAQSGFIEAPGAKLYFEAEGEGSPVILIHAGVAHLRMWDEQAAAWRDRHRVIRYDTRGWGRTVVEDVPFSDLELRGASLEEAFLTLTQNEEAVR